jgi:hypothetical protein
MAHQNATPVERAQIWNTFFALAREQAEALHKQPAGPSVGTPFDARGGLSAEQSRILATLAFSALAIEARANHLLEELGEGGVLGDDEVRAVRYLPSQVKWTLLPRLSGKTAIDASKAPHQAVFEICKLRNALIHVDYKGLKNNLPVRTKTLSLFRGFVEAMEDMNVLLGRVPAPRAQVLKLGHF